MNYNKLNYRIWLYILITIFLLNCFQVSAYDISQDLDILTLNVQNENKKEITTVDENISSINASVILKNTSFETTNVSLIIAVYDKITDRMKTAEKSDTVTVAKGNKQKIEVVLTSEKLINAGATQGDALKLFFWDSLTGMQQLTGSVSSENFADFPKKYSTNNVSDYNKSINEVRGDNWSYLGTGESPASVWPQQSILLSKPTVPNDNWYSASTRLDNWIIYPDGGIRSESKLSMIFNYTIGKYTAGKELIIKGTFTGQADTDLYIFKTNDTVQSTSNYDNGAVSLSSNINDNLISYYKNLPGGEASFEITIPEDKAIAGNDILFWVDMKQPGYLYNKLDVTITAKEIPMISSNSIQNFAVDENKTGGGQWSYLNLPEISTDGGTFSYNSYLVKGNGGVFKTDEYARDISNTNHIWYIKSNGNIFSDMSSLGYVYTLDNNFGNATGGIKITGATNGAKHRLCVLKISDNAVETIGTSAQVLYDAESTTHSINISIPAGEYAEGNDIVFLISKTVSGAWWTALPTSFTVKAVLGDE